MTQFGQAGHAGDYTPIPISVMADGYRSGKLDTGPSVAAR
jgi:fructose-bisphosphate aldolase class II